MRNVLAVLLPLVCVGGAALAQTPAPTLSGHAAAGAVPAPAGASAPVKTARRERRRKARRVAVADRLQERPRGPSTVDEALASCLALWDPATHMSKQEWARACKRVAERLRSTG
jgi:hypothetical protein